MTKLISCYVVHRGKFRHATALNGQLSSKMSCSILNCFAILKPCFIFIYFRSWELMMITWVVAALGSWPLWIFFVSSCWSWFHVSVLSLSCWWSCSPLLVSDASSKEKMKLKLTLVWFVRVVSAALDGLLLEDLSGQGEIWLLLHL